MDSASFKTTKSATLSVIRCGIKTNPPSVTLEFVKDKTTCHVVIEAKNIQDETAADDLCRSIRVIKPRLVESVTAAQLHQVAQTLLTFVAAQKDPVRNKAEWASSVDLNKASDELVHKAKEDMNAAFERSRIKMDDPRWVYDKQVDFGTAEEDSGWD